MTGIKCVGMGRYGMPTLSSVPWWAPNYTATCSPMSQSQDGSRCMRDKLKTCAISLSPGAWLIVIQNAPETVWRPGAARTQGQLRSLFRLQSWIGGGNSRIEKAHIGKGRKGREEKGRDKNHTAALVFSNFQHDTTSLSWLHSISNPCYRISGSVNDNIAL